MKKQLILFLISLCLITKLSSQNSTPIIELSKQDKVQLKVELTKISIDDQRYRTPLSFGTINDSLIQIIKTTSDTMSIESYIAYQKSLNLKLPKRTIDSLWVLQHQLDFDNYKKIKTIIKKYGYPSKDRLGWKRSIYPIFLHPPIELDPQEYLDELSAILKPEVEAGRMKPKLYATFYDNIKAKILREPQLYGTNKSFNMETMKPGVPKIANIVETNKARRALGMEVLKEGEYEVQKE